MVQRQNNSQLREDSVYAITARVIAQHKERYMIDCEFGMCYARLKTKEYFVENQIFPTVGDLVTVRYIENGDSQILSTLPRKSCFFRREPGPIPNDQAIAANFDYVLVAQSLNQDLNLRRMERYLTMAWQSGGTPVILLTKADLDNPQQEAMEQLRQIAVGVEIYPVSAHTGFGLEALEPYLLPGKTLVLLGSSGVGKSSLVNALVGKTVMPVGEIREADSRGRHTTTHRQLHCLPNGAFLIDTPGMRELGVTAATVGLMEAFSDVEQFLGGCRFSDCGHTVEPGCAIRAALAAGELDPVRWESYQKLQSEALRHEDALRRKREWAKNVAKANKQRGKTAKDHTF